MKELFYLFFILFVQAQRECPDASTLSKSYFATKTGYSAVLKDDTLEEKLDAEVSENECKVQQVWMLARHGTRYPLKNDYKRLSASLPLIAQEIMFNHKEKRGCFTKEDIAKFSKLVLPYNVKDSGQLTESGADEQYLLGEFWKERYPELFSEEYSEEKYKFEFTTANRTSQSAYHFLRGMFGDEAAAQIQLPKARKPNFKLRAYFSCPVWLKDVKEKESTLVVQKIYESTSEFQNTLKEVSIRLGYIGALPISEVAAVYDECRYESAWYPDGTSIWCKAFTEENLRVMEFHQTLEYYYEASYGGPPLNAQLGCATAADLYKQFQAAVEDPSSSPRGVFYFSHSRQVLMFLTALGLNKPAKRPTPFSRDKIEKEDKFSISKIIPFSSNIAFSLYKCKEDSYRVAGFLQGVPISLPSNLCSSEDSVSCPWPLIDLPEQVEHCNIRGLCNTHDEL